MITQAYTKYGGSKCKERVLDHALEKKDELLHLTQQTYDTANGRAKLTEPKTPPVTNKTNKPNTRLATEHNIS
jgi:hypothetical protein